MKKKIVGVVLLLIAVLGCGGPLPDEVKYGIINQLTFSDFKDFEVKDVELEVAGEGKQMRGKYNKAVCFKVAFTLRSPSGESYVGVRSGVALRIRREWGDSGTRWESHYLESESEWEMYSCPGTFVQALYRVQ